MSASNWDICPRCVHRAAQAADREADALRARYGHVPLDEFEAARAAIQPASRENYRTLREDYEIYGASTGTVTVSYGASCETCGLALEFTDKHPFSGLERENA